jgi:hypothetical protein
VHPERLWNGAHHASHASSAKTVPSCITRTAIAVSGIATTAISHVVVVTTSKHVEGLSDWAGRWPSHLTHSGVYHYVKFAC